ncbi:hypothetical protein RHSIM_Rhsim08G0138700 [Rhododendron simsii]|uniref:Uncharacterized protein n=1 Tax=Rhododendron simsii TaxID=118357 RepID=A0A834GLG8_RHOSS|nr:hypothetical protein RHSIM_Rhsim08G0138700 [Rhododendron simsii]
MADGSISFAEGLGCKAQYSIEMRRKQMLISQNPKSPIQLGLEVPSPPIPVRSHAISNTQGNASSSLQPAMEAVNLNSIEAQSPSRNPHHLEFLYYIKGIPLKVVLPSFGSNLPINSAVHSSESDSERELMEVLAGVVSSSQGVSQTPLNMEVMDSSAGSIPSSVPRDGIGLKLNQTLSPKPPDPQGPEVRDKASEGDLKGNF